MRKFLRIIILCMSFLIALTACDKHNNVDKKNEIIVYGDYKCPYCKELEDKIMPKIKKGYINKGNTKYKFINVAFLGNDSIKGSRAGHAVEDIAPKEYLHFQNILFSKQPNNENKWLTEKLIDKQVDKLNISNNTKKKIKKDYKTKGSKAWIEASNDKKLAKKKKINEIPTVFINKSKIENPENLKHWTRELKKY